MLCRYESSESGKKQSYEKENPLVLRTLRIGDFGFHNYRDDVLFGATSQSQMAESCRRPVIGREL